MRIYTGKYIYETIDDLRHKLSKKDEDLAVSNSFLKEDSPLFRHNVEDRNSIAERYTEIMHKEFISLEPDPNITSDEQDLILYKEIRNKIQLINRHNPSLGFLMYSLDKDIDELEKLVEREAKK